MKIWSFLIIALFSITLTSTDLKGRFLASENKEEKVEQKEEAVCPEKKKIKGHRQVVENLQYQITEAINYFEQKFEMQNQMMEQMEQNFYTQYWSQNWENLQLTYQLAYYQNQGQSLSNYGNLVPQAQAPVGLNMTHYDPYLPQSNYDQAPLIAKATFPGFEFEMNRGQDDYNLAPEFSRPQDLGAFAF